MLELLAREAPRFEALREEALASDGCASDALEALLTGFVEAYRATPLTRWLLENPAELSALAARAGPEEVAAKARALAGLVDYVRSERSRGRLRDDVDPEVAAGALRAVLLLLLHEADLGERHDEVIALVIALVARGLAAPGGGAGSAAGDGRGPA